MKSIFESDSQKLVNIQGLRGLSIFTVLLYHARPDLCPMGYFGVDIFFTISGFLICKILTEKLPLNWSKIANFYFRRLRRIFPPYFFTILAFLILAPLLFLYQLDYSTLFEETWKPLLFLANLNQFVEYSKRDENSYQFFKNFWSLSVEVQFYFLVPFLFLVFGYLGRVLRLILIVGIAILSFLFQWNSRGNVEHMALFSRIWQFMFGFIAYQLQLFMNSFDQFRVKDCKKLNILFSFLNSALIATLIFGLFFPIFNDRQLNRLLIILFSTFLIEFNWQNNLLSHFLLVDLGNISYAIYLVHWPLMQWHSYWQLDEYIGRGNLPSIQDTIVLIFVSIILGWIIEKSYELISVHIDSWKRLSILICALYLCTFECMLYLKWNESDVKLQSIFNHETTNNTQQLVDDLLAMWEDRYDREISAAQAIYYNQQFLYLSLDLQTCQNQDRQAIPTNFNLKNRVGFGDIWKRVVGITGSCVVEGNGTKNIVIFGNSHAQASFFGIEHQFRGVYKHLTMFSAVSCFLIVWPGVMPVPTKETYDGCMRVINNLFDILNQWKHKIDVIIVAHAYLYSPEVLNSPVEHNDSAYLQMQKMFKKLGEIAGEVVMIPQTHFHTGIMQHSNVLFRKILTNKSLDIFRRPFEIEHRRAKSIKQRVNAIKCPNCIKMEWENIWCDREDKICDSIDHKRKISYFFDFNHVNAYGSLYVGQYIRRLYDEWLDQNKFNETF